MKNSSNGKSTFRVGGECIKSYKYNGIPTDRVIKKQMFHDMMRDKSKNDETFLKLIQKSFGAQELKAQSSNANAGMNKFQKFHQRILDKEMTHISVFNNSVENNNNNTNLTLKNNICESKKKIKSNENNSKHHINETSRDNLKSYTCNNSPKVSSTKAEFLQSNNIKFFLKNKTRSNFNDIYSNLAKKLKENKGKGENNFTYSNCTQTYNKSSTCMRVVNERKDDTAISYIEDNSKNGNKCQTYCIVDTHKEEDKQQEECKRGVICEKNLVNKASSKNIRKKIITYCDTKSGETRKIISSNQTKSSGTSKNTKDTSGSTVRSISKKITQTCFELDSPEEMHFLSVKIRSRKFSKKMDKDDTETIKGVEVKEDMVSIVSSEQDI